MLSTLIVWFELNTRESKAIEARDVSVPDLSFCEVILLLVPKTKQYQLVTQSSGLALFHLNELGREANRLSINFR